MTKRPSLPRRIALVLLEHAARVLPSARRTWATAMRNELPQIENDREALAWAGGCLVAGYVERAKAIARNRQWMKIALAAFLTIAAIGLASWRAGQRPYLTPGNHQIFREVSDAAALPGLLIFVAAAVSGMVALLAIHDRKFHQAARAGWACAVIIVPYLTALTIVSLLTPGTIVNIGDSYCYDLWCLEVNRVTATPKGHDILYTADVLVFVDSTHTHHLPVDQAKDFFYVLDDQGRRYPLRREMSFVNADVTVHPGESVKSSLAFLAPPSARKLYLMGNDSGPPWVRLYFGSDLSLFHRRPLLRVL